MPSLHFKTAKDYIKRSPFQALAAFFVLSLTFFITTLLSIVVYSTNNLVKYFETRPQVIAFLEDEATAEEISTLQNNLTLDERVKDISYVSKEEALAIYKEATSDNPLLAELVSPSIFPASLEFSLIDLSNAQEIIDEVKNNAIVDQVGFTASLGGESSLNDVVERLKTITLYTRIGGGIFAGLLFLTSFLVLTIIISMRMSTRKGEIEILDLIGATPKFIRSPIIVEAFIYVAFGILVGWVLTLIIILYISPSLIRYFVNIPILPKELGQLLILFAVILAIELIIGFGLALFGSLLAISRAKRKR